MRRATFRIDPQAKSIPVIGGKDMNELKKKVAVIYGARSGRLLRFVASPVALIRASSILVVLLMVGHLSAYPWTASHAIQETQLVDSMKSVDFEFLGARSTYWNLYFGWGILVSVQLLTLSLILWLVSDLVRLAPRRLGVITGIISACCLVGAYLSYRYFYIPPFLFYLAIWIMLMTVSMRLLRQPRVRTQERVRDS